MHRFINADAGPDSGLGALGYNYYAYCGNNPIMNVDYNGSNAVKFFELLFEYIVYIAGGGVGPTALFFGISFAVDFAYSACAPALLSIMDCPVTLALIKASSNRVDYELHNQPSMPGYCQALDLFVEKVKANKKWIEAVKACIDDGSYSRIDQSLEFTEEHDNDLYLSVHKCLYWLKVEPKGNGKYGVHAVIWDTFDFTEFWELSSLAGFANNIGVVNSKLGNCTDVHFWVNFGYEYSY